MELKKKLKNSLLNYGIVLKVVLLFMLVLNLLMISSTTCYASTQMPLDKMEYMIDNIFYQENGFDNYKYASSYFSNSGYNSIVLGDSYKDNTVSSWLTYFNTYNDIDFNYNFSDFFGYFSFYSTSYTKYAGSFYYAKANLGVGNNNHPYIKFYNNRFLEKNYGRYPFFIMFLDDEKNIVLSSIRAIDFTYDTETHAFTFTNLRTINSISSDPQNYLITRTVKNWNVNNTNISSIDMIPGIVTFYNTGSVYTNYDGTNFFNSPITKLLKTGYISSEPENPENPDIPADTGQTGTITNTSGDTTGNIDLSGIQNQLGLINKNSLKSGEVANILSGETQKIIDNQNQNVQAITNTLTDDADNIIDNTNITSGDIESALGFEIAQDPYSNFWTTLTNNLKNALLGTKRSIDISFQGRTWTISLDEYMVLPVWLTIILIPFSTSFFTWVLVRQWKHIFDKLSSGNVDSILKENSEERYF